MGILKHQMVLVELSHFGVWISESTRFSDILESKLQRSKLQRWTKRSYPASRVHASALADVSLRTHRNPPMSLLLLQPDPSPSGALVDVRAAGAALVSGDCLGTMSELGPC